MIGSLKSLLPLWKNLALNQRYGPYVDGHDLTTVDERVTKEGLTFLTTTLPKIGKALDRFHSTSEWDPPYGFKTRPVEIRIQSQEFQAGVYDLRQLEIPVFLGEAIKCALEGDSIAVDCVRQLTYVFYKLEVGYAAELEREFLESFERVDSSLSFKDFPNPEHREKVIPVMARIINRILCNLDPLDIRPCHGSGATACHTPNWDKYHKLRYYPKLDTVFSYADYFYYSATHLADEYQALEKSSISDPQARVCLVPKDSRGPRVISCEPAELMFIQQGLMKALYEELETNPITSGQINFSDQTINRELARIGSLTGTLATMDLSEASDRVSLELVRAVFPPRWVEALEACRSESTLLPNGNVVKLQKFAPMGSSCCFPVEALVFWACAQATLEVLNLTYKIGKAKIFVYGDDIILDSTFAESVMMGLESVGLTINRDKSYVRGPFRESCGGDYHNGYDVTPVRVRKSFNSSIDSIVSSADLLNNFILKFGVDTIRSLVSLVETEVEYIYPRSLLELPATIRDPSPTVNDVMFKRRYNRHLQRHEHRVLTPSNSLKRRRPPNWGELLRKELTREYRDNTHPDRYKNPLVIVDSKAEPGFYAVPHSARAMWGWSWLG